MVRSIGVIIYRIAEYLQKQGQLSGADISYFNKLAASDRYQAPESTSTWEKLTAYCIEYHPGDLTIASMLNCTGDSELYYNMSMDMLEGPPELLWMFAATPIRQG